MQASKIVRAFCIGALFCAASATAVRAQTFTTIASFSNTSGGDANGPLVQGLDGSFYGTASKGGSFSDAKVCGSNGCGTVFRLTAGGTLTALYTFCTKINCIDGAIPQGGLVLAANGNFYGTTSSGGLNNNISFCAGVGCGTLFEITPSGTLTTLYNFCAQTNCADGTAPRGLVQGANGNLYGIATGGGFVNQSAGCSTGCGTIFEITPAGTLTTRYEFCSAGNCAGGKTPEAPLMQAASGNFYGTTAFGGVGSQCPNKSGCGTVFVMTPTGTFKSLYSFCSVTNCADGESPAGSALVQGANGSFYGATILGGTHANGIIYQITPTGTRTTVYNFCKVKSGTDCSDGSAPTGVVLGTDGNFYGSTSIGGDALGSTACQGIGCGTLFKLTPTGTLTTLYAFCPQQGCGDGESPAPLMQATNGAFYGPTAFLGANSQECGVSGCGTAYRLAVGLPPFVTPNPVAAAVGQVISILGVRLTGTTAVSFNGTAAKFKVISNTLVRAQVPSGATSGSIAVTTPKGTLTSNIAFQVVP